MVVLEALASGTPLVACATGDIPFVVRDNENGLLVSARSPQGLADAIASLDQDPGLAQKIVIIDDPMTSLDEHRSLTTVQEMSPREAECTGYRQPTSQWKNSRACPIFEKW